jgi:hypothetical protein
MPTALTSTFCSFGAPFIDVWVWPRDRPGTLPVGASLAALFLALVEAGFVFVERYLCVGSIGTSWLCKVTSCALLKAMNHGLQPAKSLLTAPLKLWLTSVNKALFREFSK